MNAITQPYELRLTPRGLYEIPDVSDVHVACRQGSVWITLDNDQRDIILEPGDTFRGTAHRRGLIYAFTASELLVGPAARAAAPGRARIDAVARWPLPVPAL